jgi:DnaJ-class molecular chaperone
MQSKNPLRQRTPDDDPAPGTFGAGQDVCPQCDGTGKQVDKESGKPIEQACERCEGTGKVTQAIG